MKTIPAEFQPALVVADINTKIRKVVRKTYIDRRISLMKNEIKTQFEEEVIELFDVGIPNL